MKSNKEPAFDSLRRPAIRCPFYGFEWPPASTRLRQAAEGRCGLALDRVEPCSMEVAGHHVDMDDCPLAKQSAHFIRSAGPVIAFITPDAPEGLPYHEWYRRMK